MTDINLGIFTAKLDPARVHLRHQRAAAHPPSPLSRRAARRFHARAGQRADLRSAPRRRRSSRPRRAVVPAGARAPAHDRARLFAALNEPLDDDTVVIADVGDCAVRRHRADDPPAHRVHQPGLLHVDGLRRAGGARACRSPTRTLRAAGARRRRRVPDDRHGAVDRSSATVSARSSSCSTTTATAPSVPCRTGPSTTSSTGTTTACPTCSAAAGASRCAPKASSTDALDAAVAQRDAFSLLNVHLDPYDVCPALERLGKRMAENIPGRQPRDDAGRAASTCPGE